MCSSSCIEFGEAALHEEDIKDKHVIEVGSYNINGSLRPTIMRQKPKSYLGVDIQPGPNVDLICRAENLIDHLGAETFDLVISTELLEHTRIWQDVIHNLKGVLKPGGALLLTTRSKGFHYHAYPHDYWRFETMDLKEIFSDFNIQQLEQDPACPGVFLKAKKLVPFVECDLSTYETYSIITDSRILKLSVPRLILFNCSYLLKKVVHSIVFMKCVDLIKRIFKKTVKILNDNKKYIHPFLSLILLPRLITLKSRNKETIFNFAQDTLLGIIRPKQLKEEFIKFLEFLEFQDCQSPVTIVEIGTALGGTLFCMSYFAPPQSKIISIDLPKNNGGYPHWRKYLYRRFCFHGNKIHLIRMNSHEQTTYNTVYQLLSPKDRVDILFIDGDHSYEGVKNDFETYKSIVNPGGIIAFHDIVAHDSTKNCHVDRFWNEIKKDFKSMEIVSQDKQNWGGIGILFV